MTNPASPDERRKTIWARVYQELLRHAIADSRFNYDFLSFTPDFRGSSSAVDRVAELPCYQNARTVLVTSDNSLEQLRYRALQDGKKVLVATYRLRRGFVLLNPASMDENKYALAACLDGMEKPGVGRSVSMAQLQEENVVVDFCATGGLVFNEQGVVIWEGHALFEVQWALLCDTKRLAADVPVVAIAHRCQVIDEAQLGVEKIVPDKAGEVQCDYVVTPDHVFHVLEPHKPSGSIDFTTIDVETLENIPPMQELKGIRMMQKIMQDDGLGSETKQEKTKPVSVEEQRGIDIVDKLMKSFKT